MEKDIQDLRIRLVVPEDKEKIFRFFRQLGEEGGTFFNRNGGNERGTHAFLNGEDPGRIYWAAVNDTSEGEEIVGLLFLWRKNTKVPWLGIGITEEWKGRHLGRRLMDTAKEWAQSVGAGGICLTTAPENVRGQGLYERMGYEHIGTYHDGERLYLLTLPNENVK